MKKGSIRKRIAALLFLFMVLLLILPACASGANSPDRELEGIAQLDSGYCLGDIYCQDLEFRKEGKLLFLKTGDEGEFVVISPGRVKLSVGEESLVVGYTLSDGKLVLKFDDYSLDYYYADEIKGNLTQLEQPTDTEQNVIQQEQPTQIPPTATKPENEPVDIQENEEVVFSLSYILDANDTLEKNADYRMELVDGTLGSADMVKQDPILTDIEFTRDGKLLIASAADAGIMTWDLTSRSVIADRGDARCINAKVSPDGEYVFVETSYCQIAALKSQTLESSGSIEGEMCTTLNDVHPTEYVVLTSTGGGKVVIHDLLNGDEIDSIPACYWAVFSSDGRSIVCFSEGQSIQVWDYQTLEKLSSHQLGVPYRYYSSSVSPTDDVIAFSHDETGGILLYNFMTKESIELQPISSSGSFYRASFSGDGRLVAASDSYNVYIWDVERASLVFEIRQSDYYVEDIAFMPGTRQLAIAYPKWIEVWSED